MLKNYYKVVTGKLENLSILTKTRMLTKTRGAAWISVRKGQTKVNVATGSEMTGCAVCRQQCPGWSLESQVYYNKIIVETSGGQVDRVETIIV